MPTSPVATMRPTVALIDAEAITQNAQALAEFAKPAVLCAVVKANGYGHGIETATKAAVKGGASWLAVATLAEALAAVDALNSVEPEVSKPEVSKTEASKSEVAETPVLVLSELDPSVAQAQSVSGQIRFTVGSVEGVRALASAGVARKVHLKVDTGMHRMGVVESELSAVIQALQAADGVLELEGAYTHLADADNVDDVNSDSLVPSTTNSSNYSNSTDSIGFTSTQLQRFEVARSQLVDAGLNPSVIHAANSAGLLAHQPSHFNMVRVGLALYGEPPAPVFADLVNDLGLMPAMRLVSAVSAVRTVPAGETVSYGRHWTATEPTCVATVPIGYGDGIRRNSGPAGVEVLIRGRRCPIVGMVTMDQLMVAVPDVVAADVVTGDEVVLIGRQGNKESSDNVVTATEIAACLGTVAYEVIVGLSDRIPRRTIN